MTAGKKLVKLLQISKYYLVDEGSTGSTGVVRGALLFACDPHSVKCVLVESQYRVGVIENRCKLPLPSK
jgi:hypothetical protein